MSELVDIYDLDDRLSKAITMLANNELISQDFILKVLRDCYAYLSWTVVQDATREAREMQKMTQELLKEMD
jgi:hypothetical protein|tara:strand:+ start:1426 stop:1638 length:213 start_codon:yes stop_codon:yes gene_type:complete